MSQAGATLGKLDSQSVAFQFTENYFQMLDVALPIIIEDN